MFFLNIRGGAAKKGDNAGTALILIGKAAL
jgi:hypothetical protein